MEDHSDLAEPVPRTGARWRTARRGALAGAGVLALVLGGAWGLRERIASDLIDRQLAALHLPMRYHIDSIGVGREVISAVIVGDPAHPDLTVERVEIALRYGLAGPVIDRIVLVRPRLFGTLTNGQLHFGALDPVINAPTTAPLRLPPWSLALIDARGRIDSSYGPLAFALDGSGPLANGFAAKLGVVVPQARSAPGPDACTIARTTLYADVTTRDGRPSLTGPLRLGASHCGTTRAAPGLINLTVAGDAALAQWTVGGRIATGRIDSAGQTSLAGLGGEAGLRWDARQGALSGRITLDGRGLAAPSLRLGSVRLDGVLHARPATSAFDLRGDIAGQGLARGPAVLAALQRLQTGAAGTPLAPLAQRALAALAREEPGSRIDGTIGIHADAAGWRLVMPALALRGGRGGATLARADHFAIVGGDGHIPRVAGNFATLGADLPQISGTMTAGVLGRARFQLALAPYMAGGARLAVPAMAVSQAGDGALDFTGTVMLGGPFGSQDHGGATGGSGSIDNLMLPVEGTLAGNGQLAMLRRCVRPTFDRLRAGTLDLGKTTLALCPIGGAVVRSAGNGVAIGASLPGLVLRGRSGDAAFALTTGAGRLVWPGASTLNAVDVTLGTGADATRAHLAAITVADTVSARGALGGTFAGGALTMAALPTSVDAAAGTWKLDGGHLTLAGGTFTLADRTTPARFAPVAVRDATVTLGDGAVSAQARLVTPQNGIDLARVSLRHDLGSGKGQADVTIDTLTFRESGKKAAAGAALAALQPSDLSILAKGVIANANGTIKGTARFGWDTNAPNGGVTGSGRFGSDDFDFAAAVGPVEGLSGTIEFTDLIHLVTAPHQLLKIASINPGIEVTNGTIDLELLANQVVRLNRAEWPFEGGTISLAPTELHMAVDEPRKFSLVINGLQAGRFLQNINMSNLSATGTLDGRLPLVFDATGGHIVAGELVSRAPGGNVSYVGALTYKDLSPMANYAFRMLRSIDYTGMTIGLEGNLAGEVITRVSFSGIRQGEGTTRNLITRQIAGLPIRFNVNVRAQFYAMLDSIRPLYDPKGVRDPRLIGLIDAQGHAIHHHGAGTAGSALPPITNVIQPQASGTMP
ncbi:YdbH domain-containing protein [Novosphingobium sp.]|uniref:intermembrane phospholipid transport protein YdbH family protein n=1 Tax=Novosphingobium sp. TaxID=1874826 RepID=UPI00333E65A9